VSAVAKGGVSSFGLSYTTEPARFSVYPRLVG
jgi:hypothetical protein